MKKMKYVVSIYLMLTCACIYLPCLAMDINEETIPAESSVDENPICGTANGHTFLGPRLNFRGRNKPTVDDTVYDWDGKYFCEVGDIGVIHFNGQLSLIWFCKSGNMSMSCSFNRIIDEKRRKK